MGYVFEVPVGCSNIEKYFRECHSVYALWHLGITGIKPLYICDVGLTF